jgi:hypothetical protein
MLGVVEHVYGITIGNNVPADARFSFQERTYDI